MTEKTPRVSIGMPVRNGQKYIREAIDSIIAQTFTDWELIVCDNACTDSTEADRPRVSPRAIRASAITESAATSARPRNHNIGFELARGEYFRWHAHDDIIAPEYLAVAVKALDADPTHRVRYPRTKYHR